MTTTSGEVQLDGLSVDCGFSAGGYIELNSASVDCGFSAGADIVLPLPEIDGNFNANGEIYLPALSVWSTTGVSDGASVDIGLGPLLINEGIFSSATVRLSSINVTSQTGWLSGDNQLVIEVAATCQDIHIVSSDISLGPLRVESLTGGIAENIKLGKVAVSATAHVPSSFHAELIELGSLLVSSHVSTRKRTTADLVLGKMSVSSLFSGWDVSADVYLNRMQVRSFMETENLLLADILLSAMECSSWAWAEDAEGFTADFALPGMAVSAKTVSTLADWYYLQHEMERGISESRLGVTPEDTGYFFFTHRRND